MQDEMGLNLLDYGARFYDAVLCRFTGVDPIFDKFYYLSPYNYVGNSPISNVDLWGLQPIGYLAYMEFQALKTQFSAPTQRIVNSGVRLLTGQTPTSSMPSNVNIPNRDKKIINTASKLNDIKMLYREQRKLVKLQQKIREKDCKGWVQF